MLSWATVPPGLCPPLTTCLPSLQLKAQASRLKPFPPGWSKLGPPQLPCWLPSFWSHSHLKCHLHTSPAAQTSVSPDGEPDDEKQRFLRCFLNSFTMFTLERTSSHMIHTPAHCPIYF